MSNSAVAIDPKQFRQALGAFTTGVTIVTTHGPDGQDYGLTANSFNSVSMDPPMVLWSLNKNSSSKAAFAEAGHFAVHVLATDQEPVSNRFAKSGSGQVRRPYGGARTGKCSAAGWMLGPIPVPHQLPVRRRRSHHLRR